MSSQPKLTNLDTAVFSDEMLEYIFRDRMEHVGLMSAAVLHELQTPLVIIRGRVEGLLRNSVSNDKVALKEISNECQHLLKLLDALSFVETRKPGPVVQNLSLKSVVDQALVFFEKKCLEMGVSLRSEIPEQLRVDAEPNRLKSILVALLGRAVESFADTEPSQVKSILIHTQKDAKNLYLLIADTGRGFVQPNQSKGADLSLSLAHKLANDLKLELDFVSRDGSGTSFTLSFPRNVYSIEPDSRSGS